MLSIPLPFVMSLLLAMIAFLLRVKQPKEGKLPALFILLCALSTFVVGLRWSFDLSVLRMMQPIISSLLPVTAWYCFAQAHQTKTSDKTWYFLHFIGPILVTLSAVFNQIGFEITDILLAGLYLVYGLMLGKASTNMPEEVRFSQIDRLLQSERIAAGVLLISAGIDIGITLDFMFYGGIHVTNILSLSYLILIPAVVIAVLSVGFSTFHSSLHGLDNSQSQDSVLSQQNLFQPIIEKSIPVTRLETEEAQAIFNKLHALMEEKAVYCDPDLTLNRLSRKLVIPAKKISMAVNQICHQNISKILNEYRINHAKKQLIHTQKSITEIYLESGFQSKSNFNREFSRISKQTPSEFRRRATGGETS